jgi:uncharacterized protein (TIGR02246 family)
MGNEGDTADISLVREAYERLMRAFSSADTDAYFECFHAGASFVFPGESVFDSRDTYRSAWLRWQREGVRFNDVVADDVRVRVIGGTAVVTHRIRTSMDADGEANVDRERETIVFSNVGGRWLAVHEHLSADDAGETGSAPPP